MLFCFLHSKAVLRHLIKESPNRPKGGSGSVQRIRKVSIRGKVINVDLSGELYEVKFVTGQKIDGDINEVAI